MKPVRMPCTRPFRPCRTWIWTGSQLCVRLCRTALWTPAPRRWLRTCSRFTGATVELNRQQKLLAALEQDLQRDLAEYRQLLSLTEALHDALLRRDSPVVEARNQQVAALLDEVKTRAARSRLAVGWDELQTLVRACNWQNENNGKLLAMQHDILTQILGQSAAADIYTPQYY